MAVQQLTTSNVFGQSNTNDAQVLDKLSATQGVGTNVMFAPQEEAASYIPGTGSNADKIANGYRLLADYVSKRKELLENVVQLHPQIVEKKVAELDQDVLELASILALELFVQSTIVDEIKAEQAARLEEKLRGPQDLEEQVQQFPNNTASFADQLKRNRDRRIQLQGWYFDPYKEDHDGGSLWVDLQKQKHNLAVARDNALQSVDQSRLANEMASIPSILARYNSISTLLEWYQYNATLTQKLAMQMMGHQYIPLPKVNNPEDGQWKAYRKFLHMLEADLEQSVENQDVKFAKQLLVSSVEDCESGLKLIREMRELLSKPVIGVTSSTMLNPKFGTDLDILIWLVDTIKRPNPQAWAEAIKPWEWITKSSISLADKLAMRDKVKIVTDVNSDLQPNTEVTEEQPAESNVEGNS